MEGVLYDLYLLCIGIVNEHTYIHRGLPINAQSGLKQSEKFGTISQAKKVGRKIFGEKNEYSPKLSLNSPCEITVDSQVTGKSIIDTDDQSLRNYRV